MKHKRRAPGFGPGARLAMPINISVNSENTEQPDKTSPPIAQERQMITRRLRPVNARPSGEPDNREGYRAAVFRESMLKLSRPALAQRLGISVSTIVRHESAATVPTIYRLACFAIWYQIETYDDVKKVQDISAAK